MTIGRTVIPAILLVIGLSSSLQGATTWLVSFTIDDPGSGGGHGVYSDNGTEYKDYRLENAGEGGPNFCVQASQFSTGDLFVRLNRKLDGDAGVMRCDIYSAGTKRQFVVIVSSQSVCDELAANGYLPAGTPAPCAIDGGPNPRIRIGNLWSKSPRFPIDFLTTNPNEGHPVSYEIQSDANAVIESVQGFPNRRIARYAGTAHLIKFGDGRDRPVGPAFSFPFHMTFDRTLQ